MKSSDTYKPGTNLAILLVGDQKTGKTCLSMAFPDPYFLEYDRNLDSAAREAAGKKFYYDEPTVDDTGARVEDHLVYPRSMDMLKAAALNPAIKTLIVDSASTMSLFMSAHILSEVSRMEGKKVEQLRIQDYGRILQLFQKLITFLRSTGKIVIITSHQTYDKNELTGGLEYTLAIPGQMKFNLGAFLTDVWGMSAEPAAGGKTSYKVRTRPTGRHVALGTSVRSMPAELDVTGKTPVEIWPLLNAHLKLT